MEKRLAALQKVKCELQHEPATPFLAIYLRNGNHVLIKTDAHMFTEAQIPAATLWRQLERSPPGEWMHQRSPAVAGGFPSPTGKR